MKDGRQLYLNSFSGVFKCLKYYLNLNLCISVHCTEEMVYPKTLCISPVVSYFFSYCVKKACGEKLVKFRKNGERSDKSGSFSS